MLTASIYLFSLGNATSVYILEHCNVMVHIKMKDCMRKIIFFAGAQLIQNGDNDVSYSCQQEGQREGHLFTIQCQEREELRLYG